MLLQSGQNIPLHTATLTLRLDYPPSPGFHSTPETCLFMLNAEGKVTGDADFIFYNNLSAGKRRLSTVWQILIFLRG